MKIQMQTTRWVAPQGVRLCLLRKGKVYEVSRYCGNYLVAHGYAEKVKIDFVEEASQ